MAMLIRALVHYAYLVALVVYFLVPVHHYSWMEDALPEVTELPEDINVSFRLGLGAAFLVFAIFLELTLWYFSSSRAQRRFSLLLVTFPAVLLANVAAKWLQIE